MRLNRAVVVGLLLLATSATAQSQLSGADRAAAFRAAGFKQVAGRWEACDAPKDSVYTPGTIERVSDLNGDGRPEAIITEGSTYCYGSAEVGFSIVSKEVSGTWKLITGSQGVATILKTKGVGGWPDIEVGGPGFCFPVERWNGTEYRLLRYQYDGKTCRPPR